MSGRDTTSDADLARAFLVAHPEEAAPCLERSAADDVAAVLTEIAPRAAALVVARLQAAHAAAVLRAGTPAFAGALLSEMPHDAAARILRRLDESLRARLLAQTRPRVAAALRRALTYPPDTAAGLMDARGLALPGHLSVADALARFRRSDGAAGSYLYVVGDDEVLAGVLGLRELLAAPRRQPLYAVMTREVARISAHAGRDTILDHPGWGRFHELPVVDDHGRLLGIIRYATARRLQRGGAVEHGSRSLVPWVQIGELYWVGMAQVLGSVISALGGSRTERG